MKLKIKRHVVLQSPLIKYTNTSVHEFEYSKTKHRRKKTLCSKFITIDAWVGRNEMKLKIRRRKKKVEMKRVFIFYVCYKP